MPHAPLQEAQSRQRAPEFIGLVTIFHFRLQPAVDACLVLGRSYNFLQEIFRSILAFPDGKVWQAKFHLRLRNVYAVSTTFTVESPK
jgi:hypothetical protein